MLDRIKPRDRVRDSRRLSGQRATTPSAAPPADKALHFPDRGTMPEGPVP